MSTHTGETIHQLYAAADNAVELNRKYQQELAAVPQRESSVDKGDPFEILAAAGNHLCGQSRFEKLRTKYRHMTSESGPADVQTWWILSDLRSECMKPEYSVYDKVRDEAING